MKEALPTKRRKNKTRIIRTFHLADELERITGVDLTRIDGVDVMVAQTVISEVGLDMSPWRTEAHFASWLGVCPDNRIIGDKVLARGTRHVLNRAGHRASAGSLHATAKKPNLPSEHSTDAYAASSALRKPSPPWLIAWLGWSIACSSMVSNTSTRVRNTTSEETANNKSSSSERKAAYLGLQLAPAHP